MKFSIVSTMERERERIVEFQSKEIFRYLSTVEIKSKIGKTVLRLWREF